jgi:hypothetical protein
MFTACKLVEGKVNVLQEQIKSVETQRCVKRAKSIDVQMAEINVKSRKVRIPMIKEPFWQIRRTK